MKRDSRNISEFLVNFIVTILKSSGPLPLRPQTMTPRWKLISIHPEISHRVDEILVRPHESTCWKLKNEREINEHCFSFISFTSDLFALKFSWQNRLNSLPHLDPIMTGQPACRVLTSDSPDLRRLNQNAAVPW